jgi:demethylmenaquinone methyltransferase/2-methoxy-6-polyprenyl-1,4-benzoquinol methylase
MDHNISRVTRSKEDARQSYDRMSAWYDFISGRFEGRFRNLGLEKLKPVAGETILEIGYGTGHALLEMARAVGNTGKVYGMDISPGMREVANARVKNAGVASRVILDLGDAQSLKYMSNYFNAVFMSFVLELFDTPEIPKLLRECRRVLRKQGRLVVVALSKSGDQSMMLRIYEWFHKKLPKYADCRPIYADKVLEEAGFKITDRMVMSSLGLPVEIVTAVPGKA